METNSPAINIVLDGERLDAFPVTEGTGQGCSRSPPVSNAVLEIPASAIRQEKEMRGIPIGKEEIKLALFAVDRMVFLENAKMRTGIPRSKALHK